MAQLSTNEIAEIESLATSGLVTYSKHPDLDMFIINYTPRAQYTDAWTPMLMRCRGLIVDGDYSVVNAPFPKFFDLGEKLTVEELPDEMPVICEKLDGFLGILFNDNGIPAITTRGTFGSPMAEWATKWIRSTGLGMDDFKSGYTYLFEIVEPSLCRGQGLLIDYGERAECVLLAVRETANGNELNHIDEAMRLDLPFAEEYTGTLDNAIAEMPSMNGMEKEGYVVKYSSGLRIKLKADEYKRMHRMLSGKTSKRILETMIESGKEGIDAMLVDVPDEAYERVKEIVAKIEQEQLRMIEQSRLVYDMVKDLPTRREQAAIVAQHPCSAVVFAMVNEKDYGLVALKMVKQVLVEITK